MFHSILYMKQVYISRNASPVSEYHTYTDMSVNPTATYRYTANIMYFNLNSLWQLLSTINQLKFNQALQISILPKHHLQFETQSVLQNSTRQAHVHLK